MARLCLKAYLSLQPNWLFTFPTIGAYQKKLSPQFSNNNYQRNFPPISRKPMSITVANPVTVQLADLKAGRVPDENLLAAFGPDSLGIIVVEGLPEHYQTLREKVLKSAKIVASLPQEELEKLECPEAYWLVGWSKGKEKLASGKPDIAKGSYYVNCNFHRDPSKEEPDQHTKDQYPDLLAYTASNIWPSETVVPEFEKNFKDLANMIIDVTEHVAGVCDRYMTKALKTESELSLPSDYLRRIVASSDTTKARLLHYQAALQISSDESDKDTKWCGEHLDHSCLTALTSNYYMRTDDPEMKEVFLPSDNPSGLMIRDRSGKLVKVEIPTHALAFQTGSALQEITGSRFKAVSHLVAGVQDQPNLCRNTLAIFCQPSLSDKVNSSMNFADYSRSILSGNH